VSKPRHAAAVVVGVFVAVVAVVIGATVANGLRTHQHPTPAATHAPLSPAAAVPLSHDPATGSMASRIPDTSIASRIDALHTAPGDLVARGDQVTIERVGLPKPIHVDVRGSSVLARSVYRITITAGPYQMKDMPAVVSLGNRPLALGIESTDLASLMAFTFDPSVLTSGATLKVSYGLPTQFTTVWSSAIEVVK
jgi:hypothetical protein